jgi:hypothetical protein
MKIKKKVLANGQISLTIVGTSDELLKSLEQKRKKRYCCTCGDRGSRPKTISASNEISAFLKCRSYCEAWTPNFSLSKGACRTG